MFIWKHLISSRKVRTAVVLLLAVLLALTLFQTVSAMITGAEGNTPIRDPGWPQGAALIFNHPARIAWWEGPPFGGGEYHAECRGDAKTLNPVLADFAKLDVKTKRIIVHDGVGNSLWLNANREEDKQEAAKVDWIFKIWQPESWKQLRKFPAELLPFPKSEVEQDPPTQIDVYTGGGIRWSEVVVPEGVELIDERLESHGFTLTDGTVLEGKVIDLATKQPLAARVKIERADPERKGGRHYSVVAEAAADAKGHWVLKKTPAGSHRLVIEADGYVPRIAGYVRVDDQACWHSYESGLSPVATATGRITDDEGKPLAEVEVRLSSVDSGAGGRYESPQEYTATTDADGRFHLNQVPQGSARVMLIKSGYCRPGLGPTISLPAKDLSYNMTKSAEVIVTVVFTGVVRPQEYMVEIEPEGGNVVGSWGGSGHINDKDQITFHDIPPGRYILRGHPNPYSENQKSKPFTINLKGGQKEEIRLKDK